MSNRSNNSDLEDASGSASERSHGSNTSMNNTLTEPEQINDGLNNKSNTIDDMHSPQHWGKNSNYDIWSRPYVASSNWQQFNKDFNISSSLKHNIWSHAGNIATDQKKDVPNSESVNIARTPFIGGVVNQNTCKSDNEWTTVVSTDNVIENSIKYRPITSRNVAQYSNCIQPAFGTENIFNGARSLLVSPNADAALMSYFAENSCEKFIQKLQILVKHEFLDPKILSEPISPEVYELINMLIFYVKEHSRTRMYANPGIPNAALEEDINVILYKIFLIRSEIAKCQSKFIESKRIEQETFRSFGEKNIATTRQETPNNLHNSRHSELPNTRHVNSRYSNSTNDAECNNSNASSYYNLSNVAQYHRRLNQSTYRSQPSQLDQTASAHAQHRNAVQNSSTNFRFLPTARNCEKRWNANEQNNNHNAWQQNRQSVRKESPNYFW